MLPDISWWDICNTTSLSLMLRWSIEGLSHQQTPGVSPIHPSQTHCQARLWAGLLCFSAVVRQRDKISRELFSFSPQFHRNKQYHRNRSKGWSLCKALWKLPVGLTAQLLCLCAPAGRSARETLKAYSWAWETWKGLVIRLNIYMWENKTQNSKYFVWNKGTKMAQFVMV